MTMSVVRGFKVTDAERKSRLGIAAKSLLDLKKKTIAKFKLNFKPTDFYFQISDGTLVESDEYFQSLPPQTLLIWVENGKVGPTDAEILYKTIREVNEEYLTAGERVQQFFTENMKNKVFKLAEVLKHIDKDKAEISLKIEDPDWFQGIATTAKTKEEFMFRRAQDRIRTFFYKTRDELKNTPNIPANKLQLLIFELQKKLKDCKYNGFYFDRSVVKNGDNNNKSLCDSFGTFNCQGRWDKNNCLYDSHCINPYRSREERIIFQTWNLDHVIERSRSIIPAIIFAIQNEKYLNYANIYSDLFTVQNLKLVHIVCHDKATHKNKKKPNYILES